MSVRWTYLDSSAFVKLVAREPEAPALTAYLRTRPGRVSAMLLRTEAIRALRPLGSRFLVAARRLMASIYLMRLTPELLDQAGQLDPHELRSLDAIHLAAALALGSGLKALVTYDERMAEAARQHGLQVVRPT